MTPDKTWTLFLDRDGVINTRKPDAYVLSRADFQWTEKAPESIAALSQLFGRTLVVTNQQGIGKGLMSEDDLLQIHQMMQAEVEQAGGKIDSIYHCPALKESKSFYRKPMPGMALLAKKEFPEINFKKAVMVGDTISDMIFGKNLKMQTVLIDTDKKTISTYYKLIDFAFPDLKTFADFVAKGNI